MTSEANPSGWRLRTGWAAMLLGAIDPLEGALLILPGSLLLVWGTYRSEAHEPWRRWRAWASGLVVLGVSAMWVLSWRGGIGGSQGASGWWALLVLPYPVGWWMGVTGPGLPRWVLWSAVAAGTWYLLLAALLLGSGREPAGLGSLVTSLGVGLLGVVTIAGGLQRLRSQAPAPA